jgi:hypothetical protein
VVCWMSIGPCLQGPIDFTVVTGLFHWNHALSWPTVRIFLGKNGFTLRSPHLKYICGTYAMPCIWIFLTVRILRVWRRVFSSEVALESCTYDRIC